MKAETIETAIQDLSEKDVKKVLIYIASLKSKRKHPKRVFGLMKGDIVINDGFKDIPEGFEDYM